MAKQIFTRRSFLKMGAMAGAALVAGGALSACSSSAANTQSAAEEQSEGQEGSASFEVVSQQDPATPPRPVAGKVLVAYYSTQGHTRAVAERIAAQTGGDLFGILPTQPYSDTDLNWRDEGSRVSREHDDQSLRDIALSQTAPAGFEEYETVFVGYPIWWQMAAWPVNRFVSDNDFVRKTVIPFCTSQSSSMGSTRETLEQLAGSGEWLDGQRFGQNPQDGVVEEWVDALSL